MSVRFLSCGEFVNESERTAVERLRPKLQDANTHWVLLSNLNHSPHHATRSDEIDLIAIGESGIYVIEIKHWDTTWLRRESSIAEHEAECINDKAKRVAGKLRRHFDPSFVSARLLLTRGEIRFDGNRQRPVLRGVSVFGLPEWRKLLELDQITRLTPDQIEQAAKILEPMTKVTLTGELRTFAGLINLERLSDKSDVFHRIYRGQHPTRRDRVILHLYDLSASTDKQAEERARREFDTLQRWQKSPYVPSLLDSFQDVDRYLGELYFFSVVDPAAPSIKRRAQDADWEISARLAFSCEAVQALDNFHQPDNPDQLPLLHRQITPDSLRVRHTGQPLFTDFSLSRLPDVQSISAASVDFGAMTPFVAPELATSGLAAATERSDIYALCASLMILFKCESADSLTEQIQTILACGCEHNPENRPTLNELKTELALLQGATPTTPSLPSPEYWDEDTLVSFNNADYKIISHLGRGGIGQTFKVVHVNTNSGEEYGAYVAKLIYNKKDGDSALNAYRKVRPYAIHPNLSVIYEIASEWKPDNFMALMRWIEGIPLRDLMGVLALYAEDLGEISVEKLVLRWLLDLCDALEELHQNGLIHGDISPGNIIIQDGNVILIDYDKVTEIGGIPRGGTPGYANPNPHNLCPTDDIYALAASFFHVLFDREPFPQGQHHGLDWEGTENYQQLHSFLECATHHQPEKRFADAFAARQFLQTLLTDETETDEKEESSLPQIRPLVKPTPNIVPWLNHLLSAYPGSHHGNQETRGLDSDFAVATYVETRLDGALLEEIKAGTINLIILFGNAGDGKTAFLQHLAQQLGVKNIHSSRRVWEYQLSDGRTLYVNLDGSAAWQGRSANQLLDDFFLPFQQADYSRETVHVIAINSGKLLEWIESYDKDTDLTTQLRQVLMEEPVQIDSGFRLIDLNQRSLVGGIDQVKGQLGTDFLNTLLDRLLGSENDDYWQPCQSCSAKSRCTAWHSVQTLRHPEKGIRLRERLTDALQACHQRGEIHITARELRAALSYILFGIHNCAELHEHPDQKPLRYYQRAFDVHSAQRQGELLHELLRFDPALESNAILDRELLKSNHSSLAEARRHAYFERADYQIKLTTGLYLDQFRRAPLISEEEIQRLCRKLCHGIARLENLPLIAFNEEYLKQGAPLRISPRTPTESAFWVVKSWERFSLEVPLPRTAEGLESLHTHLRLCYRYHNGNTEILNINLELFQRLLELKEGVQISGIALEGVFTRLKIFTQRLAQENTRELYGWHPAEEQKIFRIRVETQNGRQTFIREPF